MKRIASFAVLMLLAAGVWAGAPMKFDLNFGIMTDDSLTFDPLIWSAGAEIDFLLGDHIMFSPEATLNGYKFEFKQFLLIPGAILNFKADPLFVGGGIVKGFLIGSGYDASSDVALKLNAGFISDSFKLTAYLITDFDSLFKKGMLVGATIGFRL